MKTNQSPPLLSSPSQLSPLLFGGSEFARFDYEPGNGTRYELLLAWLEDGSLAVSVLNFRSCYKFGFPPVPYYLGAKLNLAPGDAEPLAELIGELLRQREARAKAPAPDSFKDSAPQGDDLCDQCMRSGVQVSRTDEAGRTICSDCDTGSEPDVIVEVSGGVAEVTKQPPSVRVRIIDHDNEELSLDMLRWLEALRFGETTLDFPTWIANNPQP